MNSGFPDSSVPRPTDSTFRSCSEVCQRFTCLLIPRGHTLSWSWRFSYNDLLRSLWSDKNAQCVFLNPRIFRNCTFSERYKDFNTRIHCVCLKKNPSFLTHFWISRCLFLSSTFFSVCPFPHYLPLSPSSYYI